MFKFNEYAAQAQFEPIQSFYLKDDLNRDVWDEDNKLNPEISEQLIQIAEDFMDDLDFGADIQDIVFCGSLTNYNWSKYSDIDLHILINYDDIDENHELVEQLCDLAKKVWNEKHDIQISGYDVEIAIQDKSDFDEEIKQPKLGAAYSISDNDWIKEPSKENFEPDEELIKKKAGDLMDRIKELEEDFDNKVEYKEIAPKLKKVWKKIKDGRQAGLDREGEFSIENLVFKLLRRNGYIDRLMNLKFKSYDKQFK
jgi:predicted nucleotidyltransferase